MIPIIIGAHTLIHGDCREVLQTLPENSIDAIVTDPPYGLSNHKPDEVRACLAAWLAGEAYEPKGSGFMGKKWDAWVPGPEIWREALRVLKPGGHALIFAGTRSMDLMCVALRLAGFELRDSIGYAHDSGGAPLLAWAFGSGFPKSLDVSKAIDKAAGAEREAARQWQGWGTALKPAFEPIILARKPLAGTVAANVLQHGTGALNIDACRVPHETVNGGNLADNPHLRGTKLRAAPVATGFGRVGDETQLTDIRGRWPANVIHDGSDEVLAAFPDALGRFVSEFTDSGSPTGRCSGVVGFNMPNRTPSRYPDTGSAARFFYCAKASRKDRNDGCDALERRPLHWSSGDQNPGSFQGAGTDKTARNDHPTVKPTTLMRYLVRLITPPDGTVLDLFAGSGSTGRACALEGFASINIEQDAHHCDIAAARIRAAVERAQAEAEQAEREQGAQGDLFQQEAMA